MHFVALKDIYEGHLSLDDNDDEQRSFSAKLKNLDNGKIITKKELFKIV